MRVVFTPRAERQVDALHEYISGQSGEGRADDFTGRIVAFCLGLKMFPARGAQRDDIMPGLRVVGFERRVMVAFVVLADVVLIEGVFYGGQDYGTALSGW